jgi:hypothetical protein
MKKKEKLMEKNKGLPRKSCSKPLTRAHTNNEVLYSKVLRSIPAALRKKYNLFETAQYGVNF